jgi:hypothetical protein
VQKKHFRRVVATGIVLALLLAILPATGLYDTGGKMYGKDMGDRTGKGMHEIERIDIVKTFTGMQNNTLMFQVPAMAIQGKEDDGVASVTFATPLRGGYDMAVDAGFMSLRGADTADITVRPMSEATLNVAGASMVTTLMDVKVLSKDRDATMMEYHKIGLYRPDGQGFLFKLDKPVKAIYMKDRKILMVDAYPSLTLTLGYYMTDAMFPADMPPMKIADIKSAEKMHGMATIGTAPNPRQAGPVPTATPMPSPAPTVTPTPMPTATPSPVPTGAPSPTPTPTPAPLAASFTSGGVAPLTVKFSDTSSGNPTAWAWDFGDGNTAALQNPVNTYQNPGTYSVTLTVNDGTASDTTTGQVTVTSPATGSARRMGSAYGKQ